MNLSDATQMEETKFAGHKEQVMSGLQEQIEEFGLLLQQRGSEKVIMYLSSRVPFEESYSKFMGCIRRYNLSVTRR